MKILYVLGPTMMSGAAISFKIIVDEMIKRNCEIVVLASRHHKNQRFIDYLTVNGCTVEYFNGESYIYPQTSLLSWQHHILKFPIRLIRKLVNLVLSEREVLRVAIKHRPDIIHSNIGTLRQGFHASVKLKIPHIWHVREYQTKDFGWTILPSRSRYASLLKSTNVICITYDILRYFGLDKKSSARAWWDAVLPESAACYRPDKQHYFLCANRISPEKKIEDAIQAFLSAAPLLPDDFKLMIVGEQHDTRYLEQLHDLLRTSPHSNQVEIHPHRDDVASLMERATAVIVASQFEGLGRMTLEAIFKGCLVLGRGTGGTKEILTRTKGGFLFNTVDELAGQMRHVATMSTSSDYRMRVETAQRTATAECTNAVYGAKLFRLYNNLIGAER